MNGKIRATISAALATALTALAIVSCGGGGSSLAGIDRLGVSSGTHLRFRQYLREWR